MNVDAYIDFASVAAHMNSPRKKTTGMHPFREMREGAVRYVDKLTDHDPFVARFDVRAYYESIDHAVLRAQLREARVDPISERLVRDDLALPDRRCSGKGMVAGGAISPLLGALYLTPLDKVMPRGKGLCGWNNGVEMWFYCLMPNPLRVSAKRRWATLAA